MSYEQPGRYEAADTTPIEALSGPQAIRQRLIDQRDQGLADGSYTPPLPPLWGIDAAASNILDALLARSAREQDGRPDSGELMKGTCREHFVTAYPQYAAYWDQTEADTQRFKELRDQDRTAAEIRMAIDAEDRHEIVQVAVTEHKRQKLIDSGAHQDLADQFEALCYTSDTLDDIEIPDPLVEGFMDKASLVRVFGPSNSLKSFVGLDLAGCVAAGIEWHGNVTYKGRVLYVAAEGAPGSVKRIRAWEKQYNLKFEGVLYPHAIQIADANDMGKLVAFATLGKFEFVVFDTQARCTVGKDENSNTDMGMVVASLDALKTATNACVMMVHHSGSDNAERARGATAIYAAMDAEFKVTRKGELNITVETMKRKDGEQAAPLQLTAVEHHVTTKRGPETSLAVASGHVSAHENTGVRQATPELTTGQQATLVTLARYQGVGSTPTPLAEEQGLGKEGRGIVGKNLGRLMTLECVKKDGSKYVITDYGWTTLENDGLTTGYHTVDPLDGDEDA